MQSKASKQKAGPKSKCESKSKSKSEAIRRLSLSLSRNARLPKPPRWQQSKSCQSRHTTTIYTNIAADCHCCCYCSFAWLNWTFGDQRLVGLVWFSLVWCLPQVNDECNSRAQFNEPINQATRFDHCDDWLMRANSCFFFFSLSLSFCFFSSSSSEFRCLKHIASQTPNHKPQTPNTKQQLLFLVLIYTARSNV